MSPGTHGGRAFEARVEQELLQRGWDSATGTYSTEFGICPGVLWEFIGRTQPESARELLELHGGDQGTATRLFALRVASEIDVRGTLDVLRQGVRDRGVKIDLAYFRPGVISAKGALKKYDANRLTVSRQLHYSARDPRSVVDLAFFVNGLPVATVELTNPDARQSSALDAAAQYRRRDPGDLFFARRTLVHFAVDPNVVLITTRLEGRDTRFLPFNVGSKGPGQPGGAGNPASVQPGKYPVSYLWEEVWQRDNWLEILQRFMRDDAGIADAGKSNPHTATRIFPRYHQWHAVHQITAHARKEGVGHNYLIEHSAGSGKHNTIAWLAHQLSSLFDDGNQSVFDKVVVITDRVALDRQLQQTISQLDHAPGSVKKIEEDSAQLAAALGDSTSKIVISTLQKYPFVLEKVTANGELGAKRYAIIIDEAHSSQGGDAAARLRQTLGANATTPLDDEPLEEYLARVRGPHPNLSGFVRGDGPQLFASLDRDRGLGAGSAVRRK